MPLAHLLLAFTLIFHLTLREGVLRGSVLSTEGEPVAAADVLLEGPEIRTLRSADDGTFAFLVPKGLYRLSARKAGYASAAAPVRVRVATGTLSQAGVRLTPGATLRGRLLGLTPEEQSWATVQVESDGPSQAVFTDEDGTFHLDGLTPGTWDVRGWSHDHAKHTKRRVALVAGEETVLDLPFDYHHVRGHAVDSEGNPVAHQELLFRLLHREDERPSVHTAADGTFEIDLHDDVYTVSSWNGPDPMDTEAPLTVGAALPPDVELRFVPAASTFRGHLLGIPPGQEEQVHLRLVRAGLERWGRVEDDGSFEVSSLSPGEWKVTIFYGKVEVQTQVAPLPSRGTGFLDLVLPPSRKRRPRRLDRGKGLWRGFR